MRLIKAAAKKLFTIGVSSGMSFPKKRGIIYTNGAAFTTILIFICICITEIVFGCPVRSLIAVVAIIPLLFVYYFQYNKKYFTGKVLAVIIPAMVGVFSTLIFGGASFFHFYLIITLVLSLLLFQKPKYHTASIFIHTSALLLLLFFIKNGTPLIPVEESTNTSYFHLGIIITAIYITITQYTKHNHQSEAKIIHLVNSLKKANLALEKQNTYIEEQAEALQRSNLILQKEIKEKIAAQQKLLASNEELEQFAYVASHDLKEPLRTVGSFVQLLKRKLKPHYDEAANEYQDYIVSGVKRMSGLLDDLLSLSTLNKETEFTEVDLNKILKTVCLTLRHSIETSNGKVSYSLLPKITANSSQISQLFQNLVSNGLKFKRDISPIVEIDWKEKADQYIFEIKDNGIGIREEHKEKIFIIFQRLHLRSEYEGTGIGLSVCKKIVQNHGGKIWVESVPEEGTSIFFSISKNLKNLTDLNFTSDSKYHYRYQ